MLFYEEWNVWIYNLDLHRMLMMLVCSSNTWIRSWGSLWRRRAMEEIA
jgi:hypothetical protein